jgi:hypothetical protein
VLSSPRVAKLIDGGKVSIEPYELGHFKIDGKELGLTPTVDPSGNILYKITLPQGQVYIDFWFTQHEMPDGAYKINVGRFTRRFKLTFVEENQLEYDYTPLGGFPEMKPEPHRFLQMKRMETSELCFPDQGYMIEWHPPIA